MDKSAIEYFRKAPENYNCAQAVLKSFQDEANISEETINEFKNYGGGRAENGLCGALYAANYILSKLKKESINSDFCKITQFEQCVKIKNLAKVSCIDCVKTAENLVREKLNK